MVTFGSAFLSSRPDPDAIPKLKFVPQILIDQVMNGGGGNPDRPVTEEAPAGGSATPPPAAPPIPTPPAPTPEPPKAAETAPTPPAPAVEPTPVPTPEPPRVEPRPTKVTPTKPKKTSPKKDPAPEVSHVTEAPSKTPPKKTTPEIDLNKIVTRTPDDSKRKAQQREAAERQARQQEEAERQAYEAYSNAARAAADKRRNALASSLASLGTGFSNDKGIKIDVGGPGGIAYANYSSFVMKAYDSAWIVSPGLGDSDSTTEVVVTVLKSGEILNARISRRSGLPALDKTVETALSRVRRLPPFPESATDEQRSFTIRFNLKTKRQSG